MKSEYSASGLVFRILLIFLILFLTSQVLTSQENSLAEPHSIILTEEEQAWLDKNYTVRVSVGNNPPFIFNKPEPHGMMIDYLNILKSQFGINFQFITNFEPWLDGFNDIAEDKIRFDFNPGAKRTPEQLEKYAMSDDYLFSPWVIYKRKNTEDIELLSDLRGRKVVVEEGFVSGKWIKDLEPEIQLITKKDSKSCLVALATGEVDGYVGNLLQASYLIPDMGISNLKIAGPAPFGIHSLAMVARKDWAPLITIINKGLKAISTEQHFEIKKKWSSYNETAKPQIVEDVTQKTNKLENRQLIIIAVIIFALLSFGFFVVIKITEKKNIILNFKTNKIRRIIYICLGIITITIILLSFTLLERNKQEIIKDTNLNLNIVLENAENRLKIWIDQKKVYLEYLG